MKQNGTIWGWGLDPTFLKGGADDLVPKQIDPGTNWMAITAGQNYLVALRSDGTLWIRGQDSAAISKAIKGPIAAFTQLGPDQNWREVYCGTYFVLARKTDGSWWAAGQNGFAELGTGTLGDVGYVRPDNPFQRLSFEFEPWALACGNQTTILLAQDGTLWSWGLRLGSIPEGPFLRAFKVILDVSCYKFFGKHFSGQGDPQVDLNPYHIWKLEQEVIPK